eukprot:451450-Amphidinium_carterae.1
MEHAERYIISGAPVDVMPEDVQQVMDDMGWSQVRVMPDSRRWRKGRTTWLARAEQGPPCCSVPFFFNGEKFTLRVEASRKYTAALPSAAAPADAATSWANHVKAKFVTTQKPDAAPLVARAKSAKDEEAGEQAPKRLRTEWATNGGTCCNGKSPTTTTYPPDAAGSWRYLR